MKKDKQERSKDCAACEARPSTAGKITLLMPLIFVCEGLLGLMLGEEEKRMGALAGGFVARFTCGGVIQSCWKDWEGTT